MSVTSEPSPTASEAPPGRGYRHRWLVLAVVLVADVMDLLDATVANLAGPSIRADLGGGESTLQWVLAAYTLTFAVGLIISARLGDIVGRRTMFLVGIIGFTLSSLACGFAHGPGWLIAARVAQGLFGASMIPQGLAMVKASFHPEDLQKAFIPFGPAMGLSTVLGPIMAGWLIDSDVFGWGWRSIFWINVPIGVLTAVLAWRYLPRSVSRAAGVRLDTQGALLLVLASALLVYPLVQGREKGWPVWIFVLLGGSALAFALFVRRERRSSTPVIEPSLFTHRGFVGGLVFLVAFFMAVVGSGLVVNLFLQLGQHRSPLHTGLATMPLAIGMAVGAGLAGAVLGPKLGRRLIHAGVGLAFVGQIILWWTVARADLTLSAWSLAPGFVVLGLGSGAVFAPLFEIILSALTDREAGTGAGVLTAVQQFAGALGVAVLGTAFFHWVPLDGFIKATGGVMGLAVALYAVAFVSAFLLPVRAREGIQAH